MSGYGSMQASPFWKWVMRITGILCFATLMTPPAYYFKYLLFDRPGETAAAQAGVSDIAPPPLDFRYIERERSVAETAPSPARRIQAIDWLQSIILTPDAQVTHPVECMFAKATLSDLVDPRTDPNPSVRNAANQAMVNVATHGAVIKR